MALIRAVKVESPQQKNETPSAARGSAPEPPPLPSMRVPKGAHAAPANDVARVAPAKPARPREADPDAAREWALRAAETKARIEAAEEREWLAQLEKIKASERALAAAQASAADAEEETEWRALRERAAQAEQREWEQALARARAMPVDSVRARQPARPPKPGAQSSTPRQLAPATPTTSGVTFTPFGHVAQSVPPPARGRVVSWP